MRSEPDKQECEGREKKQICQYVKDILFLPSDPTHQGLLLQRIKGEHLQGTVSTWLRPALPLLGLSLTDNETTLTLLLQRETYEQNKTKPKNLKHIDISSPSVSPQVRAPTAARSSTARDTAAWRHRPPLWGISSCSAQGAHGRLCLSPQHPTASAETPEQLSTPRS